MRKDAVDAELIRELAKLLAETGLTEIEVAEGESRLRIARQQTVLAAGPALAAPAAGAAAPAAASEASPEKHPGAVTSPMVGTVYLAPEPDKPAFIKVGDMVSKGQTLLIVEAMKTMNPIPAPKDGKVARILVQNAQPVEYGQALVILD
ncbi:MAG: acetyl-CoA carboxylase biotin carboxyl carrier protein [Alphaproteobacteria bacterium]|nr:acetyl-CoA carboxylase biotin carboxyl carrier protein [Alphaproteobacteria bacterium]